MGHTKKNPMPLVCILMVVATGVFCDDTILDSWTTSNYPDPWTKQKLCGPNHEAKYVCDPNSLLDDKEARQLETVIEDVMNNTRCPCAQSVCERTGSPGYRIGVALLKKMDLSRETSNSMAEKVRKNLHDAEIFASTLLSNWRRPGSFGRCGEDLIIFYSRDDTTIFTFAGEEAEKELDGPTMAEISQKEQMYLTPSGNKFQGLRNIVLNYKAVFNGDYERMERIVVPPKHDAVIGGSGKVATFSVMVVTLTLFAALF